MIAEISNTSKPPTLLGRHPDDHIARSNQDFVTNLLPPARVLDDSAHCLSYQLARCVDHPLQYILQIRWDSADGHLQGFRRSAGFADFVRLVGPYAPQLLEMRHYQPTAVAGVQFGRAT